MTTGLTITQKISFATSTHGRKDVVRADEAPQAPATLGRTPRISKLMALAIRFDHLLRTGQVESQAELARLGHVTRARLTQIMNLLNLAPDIQEEILHLPRVREGYDPIRERQLRHMTSMIDWRKQRSVWKCLLVSQRLLID